MDDLIPHHGGCHCGRVRFRVMAAARIEVFECNCSICSRSGYLHLPADDTSFTLLQGADALTSYRFDSGEANHLFCRHCGIKSWYIPRSNPDGFTVNARCLDEGTVESMTVTPFDGRHWEANIDAFRAKLKSGPSG